MIRLALVELTRLRWRRAVLALVLLSVVVPLLIGVARVWETRPLSEAQVADFRAQVSGQVSECVDHPRQWGIRTKDPERIQARCTRNTVGWTLPRRSLSLAGERSGGSGMGVVAVLTAFLMLAGTTFVGHDWHSGSMSNQLLFEPRRRRLWTAKALAVTGVAFALAAVVSTAYWLGLWATMRVRDLPVLDGSLTDSLLYGLRGAGFAAAAALGGYALTMLFRSTVATVGVLFGVSVAGGIVIAVLGIGDQWQPQKNVAAIVKDGTTYWADVPESCYVEPQQEPPTDESDCDSQRDLPIGHSLGYYGVALVATVGASVVSFRRRDVP
jgi:ABC-type transport system involved in multi-copper enzyme maturation permease subunit